MTTADRTINALNDIIRAHNAANAGVAANAIKGYRIEAAWMLNNADMDSAAVSSRAHSMLRSVAENVSIYAS